MAHLTAIHPDTRELAELLRPAWPVMQARLRESGVPLNDGDPRSLDEIEDRQTAIRGRIQEIDNEFRGQALPDDARSEWNTLNEEHDANKRVADELRARQDRVRSLAGDEQHRESGAGFHTPSPRKGDDVWDYSHAVRGASSPEGMRGMLRDQALRAVERSKFPHPRADEAEAQRAIENLLSQDDEFGTLSRRILNTGNPVYLRAFSKALANAALTNEEQRALGLTNSAGGYAVPFQLDPTIIPTSNHSVNPYRANSRVIQLVGANTWEGITSTGVTATRRAEAAEAADNAPTVAQPSITAQRVDVFVPFSVEIGQDWAGMQGEIARLIQDAKDDEEAASFTTGSGTAPAAQGVVTGATTVFTAAGTASLAVGDIYNLEAALGARFRPRASFVGNRSIYNRIRQFDTAGGASLWVQNLQGGLANSPRGDMNMRLLDYPTYESTSTASTLTTGNKVLVFGDFNYYAIVDRVGMNVELVSHLFGSNRRPTGQRGWFAWWRNNAAVLDPNAFRVLQTG